MHCTIASIKGWSLHTYNVELRPAIVTSYTVDVHVGVVWVWITLLLSILPKSHTVTVTTSLMEAKVGTKLVTSSLAVWSHTAFGQSQAVTPVTGCDPSHRL